MNSPAPVLELTAADALPPAPAHVMTDCETIALGDKPAFLSIGAVKFDEHRILDRFYVGVDPGTAQDLGMEVDARTVMWWFDEQRDAARREIMKLEKIDLASALMGLAQWVGSPIAVWSNGATADLVWLRNAYKAAGLETPWTYKVESCYRTMRAQFPHVLAGDQVGVPHGALDDAIYQATHLQKIWAGIREPLEMLDDHALQFEKYELNHRAKGTPESEGKANVNRAFADTARDLLDRNAFKR